MKSIARLALTPGMELAEDVLDKNGVVVVPAHTKVDYSVISRLERYQIVVVSVMESVDYATTHFEKVRLSDGFIAFEKNYNEMFIYYKTMMNDLIENHAPVSPEALLELCHSITDPVGTPKQLLDYLYHMLPNEDDLTYAHCLNSALIACVFGTWLAMKKEEINMLVLCAFFYDIGKLKLPTSILWKPDRLTDMEFEIVKTHPMLGYEMVKDHPDLDPHIIKCILQHHERCDGRGYPSKLKMDQIDFYAKHISIIDAYEAMTSARVYRPSLTPLQVVDRFEQTGMLQYDYNILRPILKRIADSQIGTDVRLSDDSIWEIFFFNQVRLARPMLRRLIPGTQKYEFLDLMQRTDLEITTIY